MAHLESDAFGNRIWAPDADETGICPRCGQVGTFEHDADFLGSCDDCMGYSRAVSRLYAQADGEK